MPDMTIPGALLITIGVIVNAALAIRSGDYKTAAFVGVVGTLANLIFFYRRLYMQIKAGQRQCERLKKKAS